MYQVMGIRNVRYTSKQTGELVTGKEYHLVNKDGLLNEGYEVSIEFLREDRCDRSLHYGDTCDLRYSRRGRNIVVDGIYKIGGKED